MADVTMGPGQTETGMGSSYQPGMGESIGRTGIEQKMDEIKSRPFEGPVTRRIEQQTAKVPSAVYLIAAGAALVGSVTLFALKRPLSAIFVGLWPPTFLLLGNYNKMVKLVSEQGSTLGTRGNSGFSSSLSY